MGIIPKAPVARILSRVGAERVSDSAAEAFSSVLLQLAEGIAGRAVEIAKHSGRKTVQEGDIKLASKVF